MAGRDGDGGERERRERDVWSCGREVEVPASSYYWRDAGERHAAGILPSPGSGQSAPRPLALPLASDWQPAHCLVGLSAALPCRALPRPDLHCRPGSPSLGATTNCV